MKITKTKRDYPETWYNNKELKVTAKMTYAEIWYLYNDLEQFFDSSKKNKKMNNYLLKPEIGESIFVPAWLNELGGSYILLGLRLCTALHQFFDRLMVVERVQYSTFHMRHLDKLVANTVQLHVTLEMTYADLLLLRELLDKKLEKEKDYCPTVCYYKGIEFMVYHPSVEGIIDNAIKDALKQLEEIHKSTN